MFDAFQIHPSGDSMILHPDGDAMAPHPCGPCCGPCAQVYTFIACCLNAPVQVLFVCADAFCGGEGGPPIAEVHKIIVGSQCYSRPEGSPSTATLTTMVLTDGAEIDECTHGGCDSDECLDYCGNRYIPGMLCPGQLDYSGPQPFVFVEGEQSCGVLPALNACWKFDPSSTVPESALPDGAVVLPGTTLQGPQNPNCCACVGGCGETIQTVIECSGGSTYEVERRCCCTNARTVTINFNSTVTYNAAISSVETRTIEGSAIVQYDENNQIVGGVIGGIATIRETYYVGDPQEWTQPFNATATDLCLPTPLDPYIGIYRPFPWVLECTFTNPDAGGNTDRTFANISRTCTNASHSGTWSTTRNTDPPGDPLAGQIIAEGEYSSTISVEYFGRCSGGCGGSAGGGSAGRSGVIAGRAAAGETGKAVGGCAGCGKGTAEGW